MRSPAVGQRTRSGEHTKPEAIESPVHGDVVIAGSPAAGSNFDVEALCFVAVSGELRRTLIVCLCRRSAPVGRSAARSLRGSRAQLRPIVTGLAAARLAARDQFCTSSYGEWGRTITFLSSRRSLPPEREKPLLLGVLRGHPTRQDLS